MKTVEITDELYDKILTQESKGGMPFEPCIWKILKERNDYRKMNKEMMTMMLGAIVKIPEDKMKERLAQIDNEEEFNQ